MSPCWLNKESSCPLLDGVLWKHHHICLLHLYPGLLQCSGYCAFLWSVPCFSKCHSWCLSPSTSQQQVPLCLSTLRSCLRSSVLFRVNGMFWELWEATGLSLLVGNRERDVTVCKVVFWVPWEIFRVPKALAEWNQVMTLSWGHTDPCKIWRASLASFGSKFLLSSTTSGRRKHLMNTTQSSHSYPIHLVFPGTIAVFNRLQICTRDES